MKRTVIIVLFITILSQFHFVNAQEETGGTFSIDAQIRPRFEYRNGYSYPREKTDDASSFISNRARLGLNFDNGFLSARVAAQEISVWGSKKMVDNTGNFTMHEAWGQITKNGLFARIGRQPLNYDDGRILSVSDWSQASNWHDGLKLGYENDMNTLHVFFAHNQSAEKTNSGNYYVPVGQSYKNMQMLWYGFDNEKGLTASALAMNVGWEVGTPATETDPADPRTVFLQTFGTNIGYKNDDFNVTGAAYYQTGKNNADKSVSAYLMALRGKYNFTKQFAALGGLEYVSGQKAGSETVNTFNPLFNSNHKFLGHMDYFTRNEYYGVFDKYIGVNWKPVKKLSLELVYHHFTAAQPVLVNDEEQKNFGSEIDFTFSYPIRSYINLQGGYSFMLPTETLTVAERGDHTAWQDWAFVSITINPTIFKTKF